MTARTATTRRTARNTAKAQAKDTAAAAAAAAADPAPEPPLVDDDFLNQPPAGIEASEVTKGESATIKKPALVHELNKAFGPANWDNGAGEPNILLDHVIQRRNRDGNTVHMRVAIAAVNCWIEVHTRAGTIRRQAVGVHISRQRDYGDNDVTNVVVNAVKGAETSGFRKAASYLGKRFGSHLTEDTYAEVKHDTWSHFNTAVTHATDASTIHRTVQEAHAAAPHYPNPDETASWNAHLLELANRRLHELGEPPLGVPGTAPAPAAANGAAAPEQPAAEPAATAAGDSAPAKPSPLPQDITDAFIRAATTITEQTDAAGIEAQVDEITKQTARWATRTDDPANPDTLNLWLRKIRVNATAKARELGLENDFRQPGDPEPEPNDGNGNGK